jgi:hypothetical protein
MTRIRLHYITFVVGDAILHQANRFAHRLGYTLLQRIVAIDHTGLAFLHSATFHTGVVLANQVLTLVQPIVASFDRARRYAGLVFGTSAVTLHG